jgi:2-alkenal reductase
MKRYISLAMVTLLVVFALSSFGLPGSVAGSAVAAAPAPAPSAAPRLDPNAPPPAPVGALETTVEGIYAQVNPSVVNIRVVEQSQSNSPNFPQIPGFPNLPFQQPQGPQIQQGLGSGFVWDTEGHIVTNNHVVDGASKISVTFADGVTVPAKVVGTDPASDLAVIQVDKNADKLVPVQMFDSNQVKVGQLAIAIGNSFGLQGTLTVGYISGLGRTLPAGSADQQGATYTIPGIIQTDAPINPGNSGGVLVDDQGRLIGVTAAIEQSSSGIGFVIPSATVQKVIPALINTGHYEHTWLGVSATTLNPDLNSAMNLPAQQRGALVVDVLPGSPAATAGLMGSTRPVTINGEQVQVGGDVIVAVNGQPVKTFDDVVTYLANNSQVGQTITLTVMRLGQQMTLNVTLEARPSSNQPSTEPMSQQ